MRPARPAHLFETRKRIYQSVARNPGLHFRELQRRVGAGTGNLDYHLHALEKAGLITAERAGGHKRLYPQGLTDDERRYLAVLRPHMARRLILALLERPGLTHRDLATRLQLAPSTVTWHLQHLARHGLLLTADSGRMKRYRLAHGTDLVKVLLAYRDSFLDRLVDKFIESF